MENSSPSNYLNDPVQSNSVSSAQLISDYEAQIQILKDQLSQLKKLAAQNNLPAHSVQTLIPDLIQQAIIVTDINGTVIYWNHHATAVYGWLREEVLGKNVMDFIATDLSYTEGIAIMEELKSGRSWSGEYMVKHKDQHTFKVYVHDSPLYDEAGNVTGIIGVSRDLREEIKTREFIRFQTNLLDNVEQAIVATDPEGRVFYWNRYAEELYGWKKEEILGKAVQLLATDNPEWLNKSKELMDNFRQGKSWAGDFLVQHKNGKQFYVYSVNSPIKNPAGQVTGIIAVSNDITKHIELEKENEFERSNAQALINSTSDLIWSIDLKYEMITCNRAFYQMVKTYHVKDLRKGDNLLNADYFPADYLAFWKQKYDQALAGEQVLFTIELPPLDGAPKGWVEVTINPIRDSQNLIRGAACYSRDITKAKLYEQAITDTNQKLKTAQQIAKLGYWERDLKTNEFHWSDEVSVILNLPAFKKKTTLEDFMQIVHPDDVQTLKNNYINFQTKPSTTLEYRIVLPNGMVKYLLIKGNFINDVNGIPIKVEGTLQDVTETKLAELAVKESEQRFRIMFEKAPLGIALIDSYTGHIYNVNEKFAAIAGRTIEELKTINWMSITHPEDIQEDLYNMQLLNEKKIPGFSMQKRYIKPDGSYVWIQMSIVPMEHKEGENPRHLCMIEDITQLKENIRAIELSNERFNLVAKATNDAIWDWDLVTNKVIRLGTGLEKYFGYNSETASVDNDFWLRCVHPDDLPLVLASRQQVLDDPSKTNWSDEYWFLKANGQYAYVYDKGYIIRNHEGKAIRMIGATQDITEQKRADLMLKELNSKLEKRAFELEQSNAELERFAYVASHDLQEPLRMVSSFLQLFEKKYKNQIDETADKYIHFAVDGAERMKRLIQDLLKYSRAGRSQDELGSTDMNQVAAEVVTTFEPEIRERNATIKTGHLPVLPRTRKVQMVQLLQNIISNALKYNNSKNPLIQIDATETEDHWQITIKDNGIGFDEKYADKVFMIFQRLHHKEEFSGTGIGLAICKKIMELHGGQIRVESEPGKGSIFYLTFFKTKGSTTYEFTQTD